MKKGIPSGNANIPYDYRRVLLQEFERRTCRNSGYSLRAFARDLGMAPSRLSESLNGVRGISPRLAARLARRLNLDARERDFFLLSVQAQHARSAAQKEDASKKLLKKLSEPEHEPVQMTTVTGWLEACVLKLHQYGRDLTDQDGVARSLGVPTFMVVSSLRFLTRLGFIVGLPGFKTYLKEKAKGRVLNIDQQQCLDKALTAITERPREAVFRYEPLMIPSSKMDEVKILVQAFYRDMEKLTSSNSPLDKQDHSILCLAGIQVFPVQVHNEEDSQ